jgi:hypothetical protein
VIDTTREAGFVKPITVLLYSLMKPFTDGGVRRPYIPDYPFGAWRSLFFPSADLRKPNNGGVRIRVLCVK